MVLAINKKSYMSWASDFPEELRIRPRGLIVLTGLDYTYNAVHKAIWDSFCNNRRADRVPLNFITLNVDHDYRKAKPKRTSYELYQPKGALKKEWLGKHLHEVPSVIIVFFDLDWDDSQWNERLMECSTRLHIIRTAVERRFTKIAVVLIQHSPPLPPGEDNLAKERAAGFCTQCDLSQKSLFVLPSTDHLYGYIIRLENAFYELSQNYYTTSIRRVKVHRDYLNRSVHQLLFIRHQFKIAFYNELKQDTHMALKHYKQTYGHCLENRMYDANIMEIKTIAGFVNFKICSLSFLHGAPLDAIEQFRKHMEYFKPKVGPANLVFEHSAWMSKQYQLFAELFDEAIKQGLSAVQTQHPGFYYKQAADYAIMRKQLCIGICKLKSAVQQSADSVDLVKKSLENVEFYGQRHWRSYLQTSEAPDFAKEEDGAIQLMSVEGTYNHSVGSVT